MAKKQAESGNIDYTGRAFNQDATEAMRGDIVRGLIELITNSDDAYASMGNLKEGKIVVEVEHRRGQPWRVVVRDRAKGMSAATMRQRLARLGGRTSGFEAGENRRGNLGRGAKDLAAFGTVTFESISEGNYAKFVLHPDGSWDLEREREPKEEDRARTGISRGSGTVVTVEVAAGIRCPQHDSLYRRLVGHFQLRDILSDPSRKVELINLNDRSANRSLIYAYPRAKEVFSAAIDIPGYTGVKARLVLYRLADKCEDGPENTGRPSGILIKGKRAIYDNTLFKYEGNIHSGWFAGKVECEYIDQLAREYDNMLESGKPLDPTNPLPIISRRRDGLNSSHPFFAALKQAVEVPLGLRVAEEAEWARTARSAETDDTRQAFNRLARELGRLVTEELREIEAEDLPGDDSGEAPLLSIVPEQVFAYMGEDRILTVVARKDGVALGDEVHIEVDPGGVVELLTPTAPLKTHTRREDVLVSQVRLRPLIVGEAAMITATIGPRSAHALLEVQPPRLIIEEPVVPPETLQFERPTYRIGWQRQKELTLFAPVEVVGTIGEDLQISSTDPGVVIRTPQVRLKYDDNLDFYRATVIVEGRVLDAAGQVLARKDTLVAATQVKVTRKEEGPDFRIELCQDEMGTFRAIIEPTQGVQVVKVAARHPALLPYLGNDLEGQNTPIVRALVSEAVADAGARLVVSKLYYQRRSTEAFDVDRYYREHYKRMLKFLPRFQKVLVGDPAAARADAVLAPTALMEPRSVSA